MAFFWPLPIRPGDDPDELDGPEDELGHDARPNEKMIDLQTIIHSVVWFHVVHTQASSLSCEIDPPVSPSHGDAFHNDPFMN